MVLSLSLSLCPIHWIAAESLVELTSVLQSSGTVWEVWSAASFTPTAGRTISPVQLTTVQQLHHQLWARQWWILGASSSSLLPNLLKAKRARANSVAPRGDDMKCRTHLMMTEYPDMSFWRSHWIILMMSEGASMLMASNSLSTGNEEVPSCLQFDLITQRHRAVKCLNTDREGLRNANCSTPMNLWNSVLPQDFAPVRDYKYYLIVLCPQLWFSTTSIGLPLKIPARLF